MLTPATIDGNMQGIPTTAPKTAACFKTLAQHLVFDRIFSDTRLKPATVTQCGEGSASRGQSPDPSASRFSRIQARLEVTLCITDGAPALFSWLMIGMILVHALFSWMVIWGDY